MLTPAEAISYIEDVMGISNVLEKFTTNKLELLNDIILRQHGIPFQSISLLQQPPSERHRPSLQEIKEDVFAKIGGLCYTLNTFLFYLLRAIGYKAYLNICHVIGCPPASHILVLAVDVLKDGDMYLAEVGCAYPTFQAISLDFMQESPVFHDSFLKYKFVRDGQTIKRLHSPENIVFPRSKESGFQMFYEFEVKPEPGVEVFEGDFDTIFTDVNSLLFHKSLRAMRFIDTRAIILVHFKLFLESETGEITKTVLETDDDVVAMLRKYFPEISEQIVKRAVTNWKAVYKK